MTPLKTASRDLSVQNFQIYIFKNKLFLSEMGGRPQEKGKLIVYTLRKQLSLSSRWGQQSVSFERKEVKLFKLPESSPVTEDENDFPGSSTVKKTTASLQEMGLLGSAPATRRKATHHQLVPASLRENRDGLERTRTRAEHLPSTAQRPTSPKQVQTCTPLRAEADSFSPPGIFEMQKGYLHLRRCQSSFRQFKSYALEAIRFLHIPRFQEGTATHSDQGEGTHNAEIWVKETPSPPTHTSNPLAQ